MRYDDDVVMVGSARRQRKAKRTRQSSKQASLLIRIFLSTLNSEGWLSREAETWINTVGLGGMGPRLGG